MQDRRHGFRGGVALEGPDAAEHFVEHGTEAEDVGAAIDSRAADLLGRHVARGPNYRADASCRDVGGHGCHPAS